MADTRAEGRWPRLVTRDIISRREASVPEWAPEPRRTLGKRRAFAPKMSTRIWVAAAHLAVAMILVAAFPDFVPNAQSWLRSVLQIPAPATQVVPAEQAVAKTTSAAEADAAAAAEAAAKSSLPPVAGVEHVVLLIRTAIAALDQANATNNYSVLREIAAPSFQEANSAAQLSEAFANLRGRNIALAPVAVISPQLVRQPAVDENGLLRLTGSIPSRPLQVNFDIVFQPVEGRWLIGGLAVDAVVNAVPSNGDAGPAVDARLSRPETPSVPDRTPAMPDAATMAALIRNAVTALNQANMTGNYSVLRDIAAPGFQEANTHAKLSESFAALRARNLDLSPVTVMPPQLFREPAIDERGMLRLTGFFASRPEQVNFDLAFQKIGDEWRLFGIGVNTTVEVAQSKGGEEIVNPARRAGEPAPLPRPRPTL